MSGRFRSRPRSAFLNEFTETGKGPYMRDEPHQSPLVPERVNKTVLSSRETRVSVLNMFVPIGIKSSFIICVCDMYLIAQCRGRVWVETINVLFQLLHRRRPYNRATDFF